MTAKGVVNAPYLRIRKSNPALDRGAGAGGGTTGGGTIISVATSKHSPENLKFTVGSSGSLEAICKLPPLVPDAVPSGHLNSTKKSQTSPGSSGDSRDWYTGNSEQFLEDVGWVIALNKLVGVTSGG